MDYYEQFNHFVDSVMEVQSQIDLRKVEKRYKYAEVLRQNTILELRLSWHLVIGMLLVVFILLCYYYYEKRLEDERNKQNKKQENTIKVLQEKELEVQGLSTQVLNIRKGVLENTEIYKRILLNAQSIEEAKLNSLTDHDWLSLYGALKTTYPLFMEGLEKNFPGLTEEEKHFCCLLKLGLNNQQLAIFLNIQPASVDRRRYRIRKKEKLENTKTTLEEVVAML